MRHLIYLLWMTLFPILFMSCRKEDPGPEKQYLFDGLPYYLTDTLFNELPVTTINYFGMKDIEFDSKGIAWMLDNAGSIWRYNRANKELICWTKKVPGFDAPASSTQNIFVDSRDRLWANTLGAINLFEDTSVKTIKFPVLVMPGNMAEDKKGDIHFHGSDEHEYMCDGESVTAIHPVFAPGDYRIKHIFNDKERNLWYIVHLPPFGPPKFKVIKYSNDNEYTIMPNLPNENVGEYIYSESIGFDSENTAYFSCTYDQIKRLDKNNNWETVYKWDDDNISLDKLYIDNDNNIWASLNPIYEQTSKLIAFIRDGKYITVSPYAKFLKDSFRAYDISFPDSNTVWICTSGGVFEFKK